MTWNTLKYKQYMGQSSLCSVFMYLLNYQHLLLSKLAVNV